MAEESASILIIDNNGVFARNFAFFFGQEDFNVEVALSVEEAEWKASVVPPDLIIAEYLLPSCKGDELINRIRNYAATASIPIIFLSRTEDPADRVRGLESGAVDFIHKSAVPQEILLRVRHNLRLAQLIKRQSKLSAKEDSRALMGEILAFPILEVLQMVAQQRRKGSLRVKSDIGEGWIVVDANGNVTHASINSCEGGEAFYRIMAIEQGTFQFYPDEFSRRENMSAPLMYYIMEGVRQMDELRRLLPLLGNMDERVTLTGFAGGDDEALNPIRTLVREGLSVQEILDQGSGGRLDTAQRLSRGLQSGAIAPESSMLISNLAFTTKVIMGIEDVLSRGKWTPEAVSQAILKAHPALADPEIEPGEEALETAFQAVAYIKSKYRTIGNAAIVEIVQALPPRVKRGVVTRLIKMAGWTGLTTAMIDSVSDNELKAIETLLVES